MYWSRKVFVALLSAAFAAIVAYAEQTDEKRRPAAELFDVVVVSGEVHKVESPGTIEEVTAEQLRHRGVANVGEALNLLPGVHFRLARSKNEEQVTVRGFEQEKVLILMDGIPVSIPYEGQINLADIPAHNIASIRLIKEASSPLYGPNGMGGVINIITKQGEAKPGFSAQYEGGRYSTHNVQLGHGWRTGPFGYYGAFSHRRSDGYPMAGTFTMPEHVLSSMATAPSSPANLPHNPLAPDSGSRNNGDYERTAFTFTGTMDLGSRNTLGLSFEHYNNSYGAPPVPIYREHRSGGGTLHFFPRYWRFTDWNRTMINVLNESRLAETLTLKVRGFYDKYDNTLDIYDDSTYTTQDRIGPPSGNSLHDDYDAGFHVYGYWTVIPRNEIRVALNYRRDVHRDTSATPPPAGPTEILSSDTLSFGIEDEIQITRNFSITPGMSFDYLNKRERFQSGETLDAGNNVSSFSPQIGARYAASTSLDIYGSVGRKIRFPAMRNLYAAGVIGPTGNPDLQEESTINFEGGTSLTTDYGWRFGGALFYSASPT
jgi:outer membrane receptor protein involved in Fe transport